MGSEAPSRFEVVIVGGSYAGLSAALQLVRARRRVLVLDGGARRNRFAGNSQGFLTQDGRSPAAIVADAVDQLQRYETFHLGSGRVVNAASRGTGFTVSTDAGTEYSAQRLILATGMTDVLPAIDGLVERWGVTVFQCPYCHGYELNLGRLAVIANGEHAYHHAAMVSNWGNTTLFVNGSVELKQHEVAHLGALGVVIDDRAISSVSDRATLQLADGRSEEFTGIFTSSEARQASDLAEKLGCRIEEGYAGPVVAVDDFGATSVDGVFAAGDCTYGAANIAKAVSSGAMTGVGVNRTFIFTGGTVA